MLDSNENEIMSTDSVRVPDPLPGDSWQHAFIGDDPFFHDPEHNGGRFFITVTDATGMEHKVECSRVTVNQ